ncbi:MAG: sigma-70 family RNA polymerase sigma factor [Clostridia bacterium]|nr:sigma-70 family RNA polymerase sigma factor [Clostridia bacterium]
MNDKELLLLFDKRDENAIAQLERKYGRYCRSIAFEILKNEADAEECVNDAYLKVWESIPPAAPEKLSSYVGNIVKNQAIDCYRAQRRQKDIPPEVIMPLDNVATAAVSQGIEETDDSDELAGLIAEYLRTTDRKKRLIFVARYYKELSVGEIAAELNVAEGTVMSSLYRTRKGLESFLKKRGVSI